MAALYRPTNQERERIRKAAAREANMALSAVVLQVGRRRSLSGRGEGINVASISDDPEFNDTDFADEYEPWSAIAHGVALTDDGSGIFDLAIRRRGDRDHDLQGNVTVYITDRKIDRICGCRGEY